MKLPVKTAPRYIPPQLSKKKISIFFSLKPWHNLLPNYNQLQQDSQKEHAFMATISIS